MKRYRAFNALCAVLRAGLLDEHRSLDSPPQAPWPLLIELGSGHAVIPSVAWCLKGKTYIPHDVGAYFESILTLNRIRNERMLEGLERIAAALNAIDIEPVLLKGAAHLVERLYPEPGLRVLGDLDLLIPEGRATSAVAALRDVGFTGTAHPPNDGQYHHHLPGMIDPDSGLGVETSHPSCPHQGQRRGSDAMVLRIDTTCLVPERKGSNTGFDAKYHS